MDRLACIDLPALPLQLLLRRQPTWTRGPAAVVAEDRPGGRILWVNEHAHRGGVRPGMRYAAGLALAYNLCAGVVDAAQIESAVSELLELLHRFSPDVEPGRDDPGTFWLSARGFRRLHPSLVTWGEGIRSALAEHRLEARVAIGFTRFGTLALARSGRGEAVQFMRRPADETARAREVRLDRLQIDPGVRDALVVLGVETVGGFIDLPAGGIRQRFGQATLRLHEQARGDLHLPLQARPEDVSIEQRQLLDDAEIDATRLVFLVKRLLHPLLDHLAARHQALVELRLAFELDGGGQLEERLSPAAPTLDARLLMNLVVLRLERLELGAGVTELSVDGTGVAATPEQLELFATTPRRDLTALDRAFARLRADLGDDAVVRAVLRDGHLPEAGFDWEPLLKAVEAEPDPAPAERRSLVRRIRARPERLSSRFHHQIDPWFLEGREQEPVDTLAGPYVVSGGWWHTEIHRMYHFLRVRRGEWLWIYFDGRRQRWYVQGRVE